MERQRNVILWTNLRVFLVWTWHGLRGWLEVGQRLGHIEQELKEQAANQQKDVRCLQDAISAAAKSESSGFSQINRRLEDLDRQHTEQLSSLDRALQNRVDEWARQLSGQMNQLYAAVARNPVDVRK